MVKDGKFEEKKKRKKKKKVSPEEKPLSTAPFIGRTDLMLRGMKRPEKSIPAITQRPGEKDSAFLHRCNMLCDVSTAIPK